MLLRTKGEQKAYLDGYEKCADCIEKYLTDEGKQKLECLLAAVRNVVEIVDIKPQESEKINCKTTKCENCQNHNYCDYEPQETVTEFADRCKECGARYGKLLKQEPKTGHWIKYCVPRCGEQHYKCTSCGYYINFGEWGEYYSKEFKYCPNCGAKMESEE